jgi:adenylate kinase
MKESSNNKKALIIYGPPGSGKGTMAYLLAKRYGFINFDTGQHLRDLLYNPAFKKNKIIQREKLLNQAGKLNTPSFVLKLVLEATKKIAATGSGIIFTGSPRTIFEAFGDPEGVALRPYGAGKKQKGLMWLLDNLYGRENIFIFELKVKPETSIKRNSHRLICSICGQPSLFLYTGKTKCCAVCAGPFEKRKDDNPKIFETRLKEYKERTLPILAGLKKEGYKVFPIDGEPAPYKVLGEMIPKIKS